MKTLPEEVEKYRDKKWRREEILKIDTAVDVEELVQDLGFCNALTDSRTNLPSVYVAVCGRRDAHTPRNVQKDFEASLAWTLKDEVMQRGKIYYSKLVKSRAMFVAPRLIPYFNSIYGIPKSKEKSELSPEANKVLKILRREWESSTADLRADAKIEDRRKLTKALEDLQKCLKVIPYEVLYKPKFTYLWTLTEERFPEELAKRVPREKAVKELAKVFLEMCGMTLKGDLARTLGISRKEAGRANHQLVNEGFAERIETGVYKLSDFQ
ncbi:MAG: AlkZ-related protein [Aridibacter sp.]